MYQSCRPWDDVQAEPDCTALYMRAHYTDSYAANASRSLGTEREGLGLYLPSENRCDMHGLPALDFEEAVASW